MKELEKDMGQLRTGMKECGREVEFYRGQTLTSGDRYLPVMKEFMATAQVRLTELEDLFTDMKARVSGNTAIDIYFVFSSVIVIIVIVNLVEWHLIWFDVL